MSSEKTRPSGEHRAVPVDEHGKAVAEQPPRQASPIELEGGTPGGLVKVNTGGPENTTLLVKPKNLEAVLGNAHQNISMAEHEAPTKPTKENK